MKIIIVGSTSLGMNVLNTVLTLDEVQVVGCISAPPTFSISYSDKPVTNFLHSDFRAFCEQAGVSLRITETGMLEPSLLNWAATLAPDAFLVVGWHHMIPKSWREIAPAFGVHASLLPDLAGGAPLVWALLLNRECTGVSLFQLDDGVDSGPVVDQERIGLHPKEDIGSLLRKADVAVQAVISRSVPRLRDGAAKLKTQDLSNRVLVPQREPEDGLIDWRWPSEFVERFVRAQTRPYPGAFGQIAGKNYRLWKVQVVDDTGEQYAGRSRQQCANSSHPGQIEVLTDSILIRCGRGAISIVDAESVSEMQEMNGATFEVRSTRYASIYASAL